MALTDIIKKMQDTRIMVVGDVIRDRYYFGRVERLCPEGPVPIFVCDKVEDRDGGAALVAKQMSDLCATVKLNASHPSVYQWSIKHRYYAGHHLLLRVDEDSTAESPGMSNFDVGFIKYECDAVVISDYAKGWITAPLVIQLVEACAIAGIPLVVDPKGTDWTKYSGADWICPNEKEFKNAGPFIPAAHILLKQGEQGMTILYADRTDMVKIKAAARHVFDVTGAGDIVVAVFAAALAAKASFPDAAQLASLAAGYSVGEIGTAICPRSTLLKLAQEFDEHALDI